MKKRLTALLLCAAMLLALLGCTTASAKSVDLMQGVEPLPVEPEGAFSREGAAAITRFGLQLLGGTLDGEGSNAMVSPLSVISALAMTAQGAKGETLEEMEQVFGLELDELRRWLLAFRVTLPDEEGCKLSLANAIWFKDTPSFAVNQEFLQTNASWYGADLYKAPFNDTTQKEINRWVEKNTDGMIRNILDRIPESAVMYLVNALAFDGEWASIYNEGQIRESTFTSEAGEVQPVEMMYNKENRYLETDCATGFIKRYKGGQYAFAALLPKAGYTVADCASLLQGMALEELLIHPSQEPVHTGLPKFESEYTVELSGLLQAMGMELAFLGGDFSGIGSSAEGPLQISRVLHKTFIAVDERGTKAGAATAVEMAPTSAPPSSDPKTVILDRPFLYFIFDTATGLPVFMGAVTDLG